VQRLTALGIVCFALFPIINESLKTHTCQEAWNPEGLIPRTISRIKNAVPNCVLIADIALDPYHIEGHDGLIDENGAIDNDATITALCKQSLCYARAGADILGPSDMMDGRIGVIREALEKEKLISPLIMSYCAKFCSTFYGPFRDAVDSSRFLGKKDKASYQMDFQSLFQIEREIAQDCQEGADILLIKPGSHYLDVILRAKTSQPLYPIWSYHVSGECGMLWSGAKDGLFSLEKAVLESLYAQKRAGAEKIITYFAALAAELLSTIP